MYGILSFEVAGQEEVTKGLVAVSDAMKDLRPFWTDIFAPVYFGVVQDYFATGGRARGGGGQFKGGAWAGLSPTYRIWKNKHYPGKPILVRSGDLQESLRWGGSSLGPQGVWDPQPSYVRAGTSVPYAKFHQKGTGKMPARPFLPTPDGKVFGPLLKDWLMLMGKKG